MITDSEYKFRDYLHLTHAPSSWRQSSDHISTTSENHTISHFVMITNPTDHSLRDHIYLSPLPPPRTSPPTRGSHASHPTPKQPDLTTLPDPPTYRPPHLPRPLQVDRISFFQVVRCQGFRFRSGVMRVRMRIRRCCRRRRSDRRGYGGGFWSS